MNNSSGVSDVIVAGLVNNSSGFSNVGLAAGFSNVIVEGLVTA